MKTSKIELIPWYGRIKMHRIRTIVALMATSFHLAGCAATGNLVVRVNDENGQPVEGATVVVSVLNNLGIEV